MLEMLPVTEHQLIEEPGLIFHPAKVRLDRCPCYSRELLYYPLAIINCTGKLFHGKERHKTRCNLAVLPV